MIRDSVPDIKRKEQFYRGYLIELLLHSTGADLSFHLPFVHSDSDLLIEYPYRRIGIMIRVKYARDDHYEIACEQALHELEAQTYERELQQRGMNLIVKYGIACSRKNCLVWMG